MTARKLSRIAVFCGANDGNKPAYRAGAEALGLAMAARGIDLTYGGSSCGLMGVVADAVLASGGHVTGVIPQSLAKKEIAHQHLSDLIIVESMHQRKQVMADHSDAFIALPGGFGTLDESFEVITWTQLGIHAKPFGFLNIEHYFDALIRSEARRVGKECRSRWSPYH